MADVSIGLGSYVETDVASAATCNIGAAPTLRVRITGTTGIASFGSAANRLRFIRFADALTLTHGINLQLPTSADITTQAGDSCTAVSNPSGNWIITAYQRKSGEPLVVAALDSDLLAIAALSPANDDILQRKAGAWTNRTIAQVSADSQAAGYGNSWGDPIATANFSSGVAVVDFTGLAAYRELLLCGYGVSHNDAATQNFLLRLSDDNGAAYDTATYISAGTTITNAMPILLAAAQAGIYDFRVFLSDFNNASYKTHSVTQLAARQATATTGAPLGGRYTTARIDNALRFTNSNAVNFTAYELYLYGRKG